MFEPYDPSISQTWRNRFTMARLQAEGGQESLRILLPIILLTVTSALATAFFLYFRQQEMTEASQNTLPFSNPLFIILMPVMVVIIVLLGLFFAVRHATSLVNSLNNAPADSNTQRLITNKLFIPPASLPGFLNLLTNFPFLIIDSSDVIDEHHPAYWFGGPLLLIIFDGFAIYVERGDQFSRVLGAGLPPQVLERHEKIKEIVDLRPTIKKTELKAWTKDGLQVKANIQIKIQILSSEQAKRESVILEEDGDKRNLVYPFDPDNVKKVVERKAVLLKDTGELTENNWPTAAIGSVTGSIKAYISGQSMDELITWDENSPQLLSFNITDALMANLENSLANNMGIQLLNLQITDFSPDREIINEKLVEVWRARRDRDIIIERGNSEAQNILTEQTARTQAYANFFQELQEELSRINLDDENEFSAESFTEASVILLTNVLERSLNDPMLGSFTAREILKTFDVLREQLNRSQQGN